MNRPVNERQLQVLQWIADGCPEGVMEDASHKTTAVALRNRGLAKVSKRGGWHAELTEAGHHYVEHGVYPDVESPKAKPPRAPRPPRPRVERSARPKREDDVGSDKPPEPKPNVETPKRVIVPDRLRNPHPLVVELGDTKGRIDVTKRLVPRVLRIIQGLVVAFEREGWTVASAAKSRNYWGKPWDTKDLIVVDTGELKEGIRVGEENDRTPHVPTAYELRQKERWSYTRIPEWDYHPSGRIYLEISTTWDGRRRRWSDRQRWNIEEKLDQLIVELQERSAIDREKRLKKEAEEAERRHRAELEVEAAKLRLRESHRAKTLEQEVASWRRANEVRSYLEAMERRIGELSDPEEVEQARAWLSWCRERVMLIDPLDAHIGLPDDPEPTPEALSPFLPSWVRFR